MSNQDEYPKVLAIAINAWREDSTSHTLMNIFRCWDPEKLAMVYARADYPDTKVCSRFFRISENDVLKSVFKPWIRTGREVSDTPADENDKMAQAEHERYAGARKKHSYFMSLCREGVWFLGHWKTKELKRFVREVNPDVLFVPVYPVAYMGRIQRYVMKLSGKPAVCYLADDNYSYLSCSGVFSYIHRFLLRRQVRYLSTHCSGMFTIVDKEKEETDRLFGTDSRILTKGIDFSKKPFVPRIPGKPLKFVYTGNLIIGRDKTLALLADILNEVDHGQGRVSLDIYSPDRVDDLTMSRLNRGCSHHRGFVSRDRVAGVQREADVVVFAEALAGKEINAARLSFSTKITDYLANGKCILALGVREIAPIDYFIRNDSALIASNGDEIKEQVLKLLNNPDVIMEYERKAYDCAVRNHDRCVMNRRFIETMKKAAQVSHEN